MNTFSFSSVVFLKFRRGAQVGVFCLYLQLAGLRLLRADDHISVKWQDYSEDDGRIRVVSKYVGAEKEINAQLAIRLHGVYDSISGATPTGSSLGEGEDALPLNNISDVRRAGVVDFDWTHGIHKTSFQYAHSKESDFLSRGFSVYNTSEYNKRNTGLSYGASYVDDEVYVDNGANVDDEINPFVIERKTSIDGYVGVSQVLDPNTVVSLNFTYSTFNGYLNDQYKEIKKDIEILPGLYLPFNYSENRPEERLRRIWFANVKRFFPQVNGALDVDYRYFNDSWGVESHTFDFEWYQNLGERFVVRPSYRVYQQGGADFYFRDLDGTSIDPENQSPKNGPYYSSDYRLAKLNTKSYGLKVVYRVTDAIDLDVSFERYVMEGEDANTPRAAFPDADILTIGGTWRF